MQKHVNLVDLVKSFPTIILLQNLASIQKRTSPIKFDHLAEKSDKGSISNLSTKVKNEFNETCENVCRPCSACVRDDMDRALTSEAGKTCDEWRDNVRETRSPSLFQ